jgi:hypothetical protein
MSSDFAQFNCSSEEHKSYAAMLAFERFVWRTGMEPHLPRIVGVSDPFKTRDVVQAVYIYEVEETIQPGITVDGNISISPVIFGCLANILLFFFQFQNS